MNVTTATGAGSSLLSMWSHMQRTRKSPQQTSQSQKEQAMKVYWDGVRSCDKAMEDVVDKHHESVRKSAKLRDEYRKKQKQLERAQDQADKIRDMNELRLLSQIKQRAIFEQMRVNEEDQRELLKRAG